MKLVHYKDPNLFTILAYNKQKKEYFVYRMSNNKKVSVYSSFTRINKSFRCYVNHKL